MLAKFNTVCYLQDMNYFDTIPQVPPALVFIVFLCSILLKGLALWKASKFDQRNWFIVLLIINTAGILEIIYLFGFATKKMKLAELKFWEALSK